MTTLYHVRAELQNAKLPPRQKREALTVGVAPQSVEQVESLWCVGETLWDLLSQHYPRPRSINILQKQVQRRWREWVNAESSLALLPPYTRNLLCQQLYNAHGKLSPWQLNSLTFPASQIGCSALQLELPDDKFQIELAGNKWLLEFMQHGCEIRNGEPSRAIISSVTFWRNSEDEWRVRVKFARETISTQRLESRRNGDEEDYRTMSDVYTCITELFSATRSNQASRTIIDALAKNGIHFNGQQLRAYMLKTFNTRPRSVLLTNGEIARGYPAKAVLPVLDAEHVMAEAETAQQQQMQAEADRQEAEELVELVAWAATHELPPNIASGLARVAAGELDPPLRYAFIQAVRSHMARSLRIS